MNIFTERKSIRNYDLNNKITKKELISVLNLANRAPSSMNLQPTRLFIIESTETKEKLRPLLFGNVSQLETSSYMIVLFTDLNKYDLAPKIFNSSYELGIMPKTVRDSQLLNIEGIKSRISSDRILQDGLLDAGLFASQLMLASKSKGFDTCAIGGFDRTQINDVFNIDKSLYPALIISIGRKNEEGYTSYRLDLDDIVTYL